MTLRKLGSRAKHWIKRLKLEHWEFDLGFADQDDLLAGAGEWVYGRTWPNHDEHTARIRIFRSADVNPTVLDIISGGDVERSQELTLIHELLHVRLDPASTLASDACFESGLNHLAEILYEQHHA